MFYFDLAVIFYILSCLLLIINFYFNKTILQTLQTVFTSIAIIANIVALLLHWQDMRMAHAYTIFDLMVFVSLALAIVYLLINLKYKRPDLGLFILPMVIIAGLVALFTASDAHGAADSMSFAMDNLWLYIHIPLIIIGTAFFLTAFATGLMYFIMEKQLKQKKFGKIFERFPSLDTIDKINSASLYIGFASYTAGTLCAAGWVSFRVTHAALFDSNPDLGPSFQLKLLFAVIVWIMFGVILILKIKRGMTPRQTALASVLGFISVLLAYTAVALFILRS